MINIIDYFICRERKNRFTKKLKDNGSTLLGGGGKQYSKEEGSFGFRKFSDSEENKANN